MWFRIGFQSEKLATLHLGVDGFDPRRERVRQNHAVRDANQRRARGAVSLPQQAEPSIRTKHVFDRLTN